MKTAKAYALFRVDRNGGLHSMYVDSRRTIPMNMWVYAVPGERLPSGKVKSRLGGLSYRPGKHLASLPLATHIGVKQGKEIVCRHPYTVWCEVEYTTEIDYTPQIGRNGLDIVPRHGFYRFQTNTSAVVPWIICGEYKIVRRLSEDEVKDICKQHGFTAQPTFTEYFLEHS